MQIQGVGSAARVKRNQRGKKNNAKPPAWASSWSPPSSQNSERRAPRGEGLCICAGKLVFMGVRRETTRVGMEIPKGRAPILHLASVEQPVRGSPDHVILIDSNITSGNV